MALDYEETGTFYQRMRSVIATFTPFLNQRHHPDHATNPSPGWPVSVAGKLACWLADPASFHAVHARGAKARPDIATAGSKALVETTVR